MSKNHKRADRRRKTTRASQKMAQSLYKADPDVRGTTDEHSYADKLRNKIFKDAKSYAPDWIKPWNGKGWNNRKEYTGNEDFQQQREECGLDKTGKSLPKENRRDWF